MVNEQTLSKCRKGVKIINVARGGTINEQDLLTALQSGQVGGAALDVYENEPPKNTDLLTHPNLIGTPHMGASTKEAQRKVAEEIATQFIDLTNGKKVQGQVNQLIISQYKLIIPFYISGELTGKVIEKFKSEFF